MVQSSKTVKAYQQHKQRPPKPDKHASESDSDDASTGGQNSMDPDAGGGDGEGRSVVITNQFDVDEQVRLDTFTLVVGKRRYGKTTMTRDWISKIYQYFPDGGYVFTGSKHNRYWGQHFPESRIYDGFQPSVLEAIMRDQEQKVNRMIAGEQIIPFILIVFEDLAANVHLKYEEVFKKLAFNGRHFFVCIFYLTQDIKSVGPDVRQNADIVAFTYQTQKRSMDAIEADWAALFHRDMDMAAVVQQNTQDYQMLVIDQTVARYDASEAFFVYSAEEDPEPFAVGDALFWYDSGCSWEKQLKDFKAIPKRDKKEWLPLVEARKKQDDENKERYKHLTGEGVEKFEVNGLWAAPQSIQDSYRQRWMQKHRVGNSYYVQAMENVTPTALFKHIPNPQVDAVFQNMFY
jgi:hypothetical protein